MKKAISFFVMLAILLGLLPTAAFAAGENAAIFEDISESDYFYESVLWAYENEITTGTTANCFSPYRECSRAQTVTFLWRAAGSPTVSDTNPFTDVNPEDYFYQAVLWAYSNDITKGTSPTEFSPYDIVTRGQFVTFLYRYAGKPDTSGENPFTDNKKAAFYYDAVIWANDTGITTGATPQTFRPSKPCTRGQTVTFLYRYVALETPEEKKLTSEEISKKCSDAVFYVRNYSLNGTAHSSGSGFFISADGYAITNLHVIANAGDILIRTNDGTVYGSKERIKVIDYDSKTDLALIKVPGENFDFLTVGNSDDVRQGQMVYAFGCPNGLANTMSQGIISNPHRQMNGIDSIQISVAIAPGSSGGALVDEYGNVVGVTSSGYNSVGELNFAVPIALAEALDRNRIPGDNPADKYGVALDFDTYEGYDYVPDFGDITGAELISQTQYATGCLATYNLTDFYNLFDWSAETRLDICMELYAYAMEQLGLTPLEVETDSMLYGNETEGVLVLISAENLTIYISYGENDVYYEDFPALLDFGWYSGLEVYKHYENEGSIIYVYDFSSTYTKNGFLQLLFDYFDQLIEYEGFTYIQGNDSSNIYEFEGNGLNVMAGILSNRYLMIDILPLEES